jgi:hypothetical protein
MKNYIRPGAILVLTNDYCPKVSKTSHYLGLACKRVGLRSFVRDTADARWLSEFVKTGNFKMSKDLGDIMTSSKFVPFVQYAEIDIILSIDMNWLFPPESFVPLGNIHEIHSLWFRDLRDFLSPLVPSRNKNLWETIHDSKITHHFSNQVRDEEGQLLELENRKRFLPAAPQEYTIENHPCEFRDKMAFLGNPSSNELPKKKALKLIQEKASLEDIRRCVKDEILQDALVSEWKKQEPKISELLDSVVEKKISNSDLSTLGILLEGIQNLNSSFEKFQNIQEVFRLAPLIKKIFRYDRPAAITRLYSQNLIDVYGSEENWKPYGVQTKKFEDRYPIRSCDLSRFYQSYICYLNIPNSEFEETIDEKLFEVAASARTSLTFDNVEANAAFASSQEFYTFQDLNELEEKARELLDHPSNLFLAGEKSREKICAQHTWDHRLQEIFDF